MGRAEKGGSSTRAKTQLMHRPRGGCWVSEHAAVGFGLKQTPSPDVRSERNRETNDPQPSPCGKEDNVSCQPGRTIRAKHGAAGSRLFGPKTTWGRGRAHKKYDKALGSPRGTLSNSQRNIDQTKAEAKKGATFNTTILRSARSGMTVGFISGGVGDKTYYTAPAAPIPFLFVQVSPAFCFSIAFLARAAFLRYFILPFRTFPFVVSASNFPLLHPPPTPPVLLNLHLGSSPPPSWFLTSKRVISPSWFVSGREYKNCSSCFDWATFS